MLHTIILCPLANTPRGKVFDMLLLVLKTQELCPRCTYMLHNYDF
jgi:hypothetical protein